MSRSESSPLRLMIYDDTCRGDVGGVMGLTHSWIAGGLLYRGLGRLDAYRGVTGWEEALSWLADYAPDREIDEIQYWGHGRWGTALINKERLDVGALERGHRYFDLLDTIRARLSGPRALWWFRTCETFGAAPGHDFATRWTRFFNCRAAGHTHIIGPWQSGLHCLRPGDTPRWSLDEGLAEGTPQAPKRALWSGPSAPNSITCLKGAIPAAFEQRPEERAER